MRKKTVCWYYIQEKNRHSGKFDCRWQTGLGKSWPGRNGKEGLAGWGGEDVCVHALKTGNVWNAALDSIRRSLTRGKPGEFHKMLPGRYQISP